MISCSPRSHTLRSKARETTASCCSDHSHDRRRCAQQQRITPPARDPAWCALLMCNWSITTVHVDRSLLASVHLWKLQQPHIATHGPRASGFEAEEEAPT